MRMKVKKVKLSSGDIKRIYFETFPKKERMPFPMMVAMSKLWNTRFWGFYESGVPCGLAYLALNRKIVFVMFLAVDKSLRSKGYGSALLREIHSRYPDKKIIISLEPCDANAPDIALRKRRKAFYMRNGYKETGYRVKLHGIEQEIIVTNGEFIKREFQLFFAIYSNGTMYPRIWEQRESQRME
ncbi:MAG: GNAT family N-acetyltransferase [Clostridiales bacterium]|nr:GNAT family N-acetyltransferase [Clostridiales bacterium]